MNAQTILEPAAIAAGAVLYASWGYEQTNVDFYRVDKVAGAFATLRKIESQEVSDGGLTLTGRSSPRIPHQPIGAPFRRKILEASGEQFVRIRSYSYAYVWDGRPKRFSSYA